jgi:hypothetical protein
MRDRALEGYKKWGGDRLDPVTSIAFLKENGIEIDPKIILALGRQDPVAAQELLDELRADTRSSFRYHRLAKTFSDALAKEDPSLLNDLLATAKEPPRRMELRLQQFEARLVHDPVAAEKETLAMPNS